MTEIVKRDSLDDWKALCEIDLSDQPREVQEALARVVYLVGRVEAGEEVIEELFLASIKRAQFAMEKVEADKRWRENLEATMGRILFQMQNQQQRIDSAPLALEAGEQ